MKAANLKEQATLSGGRAETARQSSHLPTPFNLGAFLHKHSGRLIFGGLFILGAGLVLGSAFTWRHRLQMFHWPTVPGTMTQAQVEWRGSRYRGYWQTTASYTYQVGNKTYRGQRVTPWTLQPVQVEVRDFIEEHPAGSTVDVYYNPRRPGDAVLIPGCDRRDFLSLGGVGLILIVGCGFVLWQDFPFLLGKSKKPSFLADLPNHYSKNKPRKPSPNAKSEGKPWLTYEPAYRGRLVCFPHEEWLLDFLGHRGSKGQDWRPEDRAIDSSGRVFRFVYRPDCVWYDLEPTGETWDDQKVLDLVIANYKLRKCTPDTLRQRVAAAPGAEKIRVVLDSMDPMREVPSLVAALFIILVPLLFGAGVFYFTLRVVNWLSK